MSFYGFLETQKCKDRWDKELAGMIELFSISRVLVITITWSFVKMYEATVRR